MANPPIEGQDSIRCCRTPASPSIHRCFISAMSGFRSPLPSRGRADPAGSTAFGRGVRPWTLIAWIFLTLGIAMGSYWAYYTLGWGGFWFWDPVENASLMPWLAATALFIPQP